MREIELKFKIDNMADLVKRLEDLGCKISNYKIQNDTIYVADLNNTESVKDSVWLRVRKVDDLVELNYKKQSAKKSESEEIEFQVSDYEKANSFLAALGYKEWVRVNKKRRTTKYQEINICLDEVEQLGFFVELEYLVQNSDKKNYEEELINIATSLGIKVENIVNSHYDTMIAELNK